MRLNPFKAPSSLDTAIAKCENQLNALKAHVEVVRQGKAHLSQNKEVVDRLLKMDKKIAKFRDKAQTPEEQKVHIDKLQRQIRDTTASLLESNTARTGKKRSNKSVAESYKQFKKDMEKGEGYIAELLMKEADEYPLNRPNGVMNILFKTRWKGIASQYQRHIDRALTHRASAERWQKSAERTAHKHVIDEYVNNAEVDIPKFLLDTVFHQAKRETDECLAKNLDDCKTRRDYGNVSSLLDQIKNKYLGVGHNPVNNISYLEQAVARTTDAIQRSHELATSTKFTGLVSQLHGEDKDYFQSVVYEIHKYVESQKEVPDQMARQLSSDPNKDKLAPGAADKAKMAAKEEQSTDF